MAARRMIWKLWLLAAAGLAVFSVAAAQSPPTATAPHPAAATPSPEQTSQLIALEKTALEHEKAGKSTQAITVREELLARQRALYGNGSPQALASLRSLA